MSSPVGFYTDTDALRWYARRCADTADELTRAGARHIGAAAEIPEAAWGNAGMAQLLLLSAALDRLKAAYEQARAAATIRLSKISLHLSVADVNLHRAADAYDTADRAAAGRAPR